MNVRQLSYFMEVYRQGSIAGAARTLFISPQGISKTILSLEEELSVELFIRKGRKLIPTQDAIALTRPEPVRRVRGYQPEKIFNQLCV